MDWFLCSQCLEYISFVWAALQWNWRLKSTAWVIRKIATNPNVLFDIDRCNLLNKNSSKTIVSCAPRQPRGSICVRHFFGRSGLCHYQGLQPRGAQDLQLRQPEARAIQWRQREFWLGRMQRQYQLRHQICKGLCRCTRKNGERCSRTNESAQQPVWADGER